MKEIIPLAFLLLATTQLFSQKAIPSKNMDKQAYLDKARKQNNAGWMCLSGGGLLIIGAKTVYPKNYNPYYDINTTKQERQAVLSAAMFWTGIGSLLTSIPLFIASSRNKMEAKNLTAQITLENMELVRNNEKLTLPYPAVLLRFNLRY